MSCLCPVVMGSTITWNGFGLDSGLKWNGMYIWPTRTRVWANLNMHDLKNLVILKKE